VPGKRGSVKRPQGRPRQDGSVATGSPRDDIIRAATRLFAERGYAFTSITQIAHAAGLQQSSLYYYFRSKEELLHAALAVNREALVFAVDVIASPAAASEKLYRLLRYDTLQLCLSPFDFNEIEQLAESQPEDFSNFWEDYNQLHGHVVALIQEGLESGEFIQCDPGVAASSALCLDEGIQKRYRTQSRHAPGSSSPFILDPRRADEYAESSARMSLTALLCRPAELDEIAHRVRNIDGTSPNAAERA
jgi:AcrR family transcriptional regulator